MNRQNFVGRAAALAVGALAFAAPNAGAQGVATSAYFVQHNFVIIPGGNLLPSVQGIWYDHVYVSESLRRLFAVNPSIQTGGWNGFGRDWLVSNNRVMNQGLVAPVQAVRGIVLIPATGGFQTNAVTIAPGPSSALARTSITVNPFVAGGPVTGVVRCDGFATAAGGPPGTTARAYSFASCNVEVRGRLWFFGRIIWGPVLRDSVSGSGQADVSVPRQRRVDPVVARILAPDGTTAFEEPLLWIESQLVSDGEMIWENGTLELFTPDGLVTPDADLKISMSAEWVMNPGALELQVRGGVVTVSEDSGMFDGFLPPAGEMMPRSIPLPLQIEFDYNLPTDRGEIVEFDVGGGSNLTEPCRADFNGDEVGDFFDYLDFVAAWDAEDPSADINGDEVIDFFDYLDFVADFDRGCD